MKTFFKFLFNTFLVLQSTAINDHKIKPFENIAVEYNLNPKLYEKLYDNTQINSKEKFH